MQHEFKTWPEPFQAIIDGKKSADYRVWDKPELPKEGDELYLREWEPSPDYGKMEFKGETVGFVKNTEGEYTGNSVRLRIDHVIDCSRWQQKPRIPNTAELVEYVLCFNVYRQVYNPITNKPPKSGIYWVKHTGGDSYLISVNRELDCYNALSGDHGGPWMYLEANADLISPVLKPYEDL